MAALLVAFSACGGSTAPAASAASEPVAKPGAAANAPSTPSRDEAAFAEGTSAIKAENWERARAAFETAIRDNPRRADAYYYLGVVMEKTKDPVSAEAHYKKALSLSPDLHEAAENLTAIYIDARQFDDAVAVAKQALARNRTSANLLLNLAVALSGKGEVNAASKAFEDAMALSPNDARFYLAYAHHLVGAQKTDLAVAKLKQAERIAGDDAALLGTIGFEFRTARAVPECIAAFDKAIALKDNADFRANRALCKYAAQDKAGAIADLKAATQADPTFAPAHYWLGSWLHEDGRFNEAVVEYSAYLKAAPSGPLANAAEAKKWLAKKKKKPLTRP
jgi:tetratricopeptide (TPR) repeat protein